MASATSDTGKAILPKHLRLIADSLSVSGEFVGLNGKGMARQRQHASVSSPFVQACFSVSFHIYDSSHMLHDLSNNEIMIAVIILVEILESYCRTQVVAL